jgi:DMSO/TMAO reductase YedYZ molybdopterin-dependent catalytic subunit
MGVSTSVGPAAPTGLAGRYRSDLHDPRLAAWLGVALGVTFTTCFATGLLSHLIQNPPGWFTWPSRPAGFYRITQGVHVATGLASIPVLIAKLWVVAPRFWARPAVRSPAHAVERAMLLPLVGGGVFLLVTGTLNTFRWYPWEFFFTRAHYWAAWITVGGILAHVSAKAAVTGQVLRGGHGRDGELTGRADPGERRWFLGGVAAAAVAITVATVGQTLRPFRALSVLAPRDPAVGPQGLPVNKTADAAGITDDLVDDTWRLAVTGRVERPLSLSLADLAAFDQREATLPISCVEGWSANGRWRGVPLRAVLSAAGAPNGAEVTMESLEPGGLFRSSEVTATVLNDPDTLLAIELNGEALHIDHGYPLRLIAPNRPGVMQTKWLVRIEVR